MHTRAPCLTLRPQSWGLSHLIVWTLFCFERRWRGFFFNAEDKRRKRVDLSGREKTGAWTRRHTLLVSPLGSPHRNRKNKISISDRPHGADATQSLALLAPNVVCRCVFQCLTFIVNVSQCRRTVDGVMW